MNKEIKNKFDNFEVKPPDYILQNLKQDLGFAKQSFLVKHKYFIAASVVSTIIAVFVFTKKQDNNLISNTDVKNTIEIQKQKPSQNNIKTEKKEIVRTKTNKAIDNNYIVQKTIKENNSNNKENKIVKNNKLLISHKNITKINAGNDISVCGKECNLGENSNIKIGNWLANSNITFANINKPRTFITSKSFGKQVLIWSEKTNNGNILDTVVINFKKVPNSLHINTINEHCGRNDAIVEFVTKDGNYKFRWSDNKISSNPTRKNLSTGNYSVTVSSTNGCSYNYNIKIVNTESVDVNFYHTELYSAINNPIYFTDRTKVTSIDKNELTYKWDFGDGTSSNKINPEHKYTKAGKYEVTLKVSTKNACANTYKSSISINEKENIMPNIFTPNGDGIHDILVINPKPLKNFKGIIFNKTGQQIYEWDNQYEGWNGKLKNGSPAAEGVYYYVITGIDLDGKKSQYRSFIHLTR